MNLNVLMRNKIVYLKDIIIQIMKQKNALKQKKIVLIEDIRYLIKDIIMNVHLILKKKK